MRKCASILLFVACALAPRILRSQSAASLPVLRYHYGDNPAWANQNFDDSAWPSAKDGVFPSPAYESDGYFWVRARVPVPAGNTGPLAIETQTQDPFPNVQELWVNGRLAGRYGNFPPHARPLIHPQILVFDIPAGVAQPGTDAQVALRTWNRPSDGNESLFLGDPDPVRVQFSIAPSLLLHSLASQAHDRAWLNYWPQLTLTILFVTLGLAVLALGIRARNRTLVLCALWLVTLPIFIAVGQLGSLLVGTPVADVSMGFFLANALGMCIVVEFIWTVQAFPDRIFRAAAHLCWIGLTIAGLYSTLRMQPGPSVAAGMLIENWLLFLFNVIIGGAQLVALVGRGRNRLVAAAMLLIDIVYFLGIAGYAPNFSWQGISLFHATFDLSSIFVVVLLIRQAWTAWRKAEDMRIEFAAARELQQQLVPAEPPAIAGWQVKAAYIPATEVGGDFYHIIEQPGATLLLIGDVSGKGLKAAMTGLLTIGAASAIAGESAGPAQLLARLNREMFRLQKGGFITCLCARFATDGAMTLANAGHIPPYGNGQEIQLDNGLPLGIARDAIYIETAIKLAPNDRLTLLTDGVVEAQNATRELFGFERTAAISRNTAGEIARAAQAFGQEDDITVLTLEFAPAEVLHA